MPLTNAQIRDFFTQATQMAIPVPTVDQLVSEGISNVDDLAEFDETSFKQVIENLRRPPGVDAAGNPNRPFTFGAKSQMRLLAAFRIGEVIPGYRTPPHGCQHQVGPDH